MVELAPGAVVRVMNPGLVGNLWVKEGPLGPPGRSITSVTRTSGDGSPGSDDTYMIAFSDGDAASFTIHNGTNGADGTSIASIARTAGDGSPGSTDTYTVTLTDSSTTTFQVYNGNDGAPGTDGVGVPAGGTSGQVLAKTTGTNYDTEWTDPPSGGGLLAKARYAPTTTANYQTTSSAPVDLDASNLSITFSAPDSGSVIIALTALIGQSASGGFHGWALRNGSTTVASTYLRSANTNSELMTPRLLVTGLSAGQAYTFKWAQFGLLSTTTYTTYAKSDYPALMEVWSA